MRLKKLLANRLLLAGLVLILIASMLGRIAYARSAEDIIRETVPQQGSSHIDWPSGNTTNSWYYPDTETQFSITQDKDGKLISTTTERPDGKGGTTSIIKDKDGSITTRTFDGKGHETSITMKDKNGFTVTRKFDSNGKDTSITITDASGLRRIYSCNSPDGCKNILEKSESLTSGHDQPMKFGAGTDGQSTGQTSAGGVSGTRKLQTEASQKINDKSQVQDLITGGKEKLNVGTSGLTSGQTSLGEGLGKHSLQTEVLHQIKEKPNDQDWSSTAGSSSSIQIQRKKHK
jgi:hypothetical protein